MGIAALIDRLKASSVCLTDDGYIRAEREAIINEPELPPPGTEARRVIDLAHERLVRGYLAIANGTKT